MAELDSTHLGQFLKQTLSRDSIDEEITKETIDYNNNVLKKESAGDHPLEFMDYPDPNGSFKSIETMNSNQSQKNFEKNLDSDSFWYIQPNIIWQQNRLLEFIPNDEMTMIEKLNAIVRFSIYSAILLILFMQKHQAIWFPILIMIFTIWFYNDSKNRIDTYLSTKNIPKKDFFENLTNSKIYTKPTFSNPMMNINVITDPRDKPPAEPSWNNMDVKNNINEKLNFNLYRNVSDVWDKETMKRTFYTMPSTTIPNNQSAFAKWCYNTGPICKEQTAYCASPLWPPSMNENVMPFINSA